MTKGAQKNISAISCACSGNPRRPTATINARYGAVISRFLGVKLGTYLLTQNVKTSIEAKESSNQPSRQAGAKRIRESFATARGRASLPRMPKTPTASRK